MVTPRLSTVVLDNQEVDACNDAVQVYARSVLFFRNDEPSIDDAFARAQHLKYAHADNSMSRLIRSIPGTARYAARLSI